MFPKKPIRWPISVGAISPDWRWFWDKALVAPPLWDAGGINTYDPVARKYYTMVGMTPTSDWVNSRDGKGINFGSGNDERLRFDHSALDGQTDLTFYYLYSTTDTGQQAVWSGHGTVVPDDGNNILVFHISNTDIRFYAGGGESDFTATTFPSTTSNGAFHAYMFERDQTGSNLRVWYDDPETALNDVAEVFTTLNLVANGLLIGQEQDDIDGGFDINQKTIGTVDAPFVFRGILTDAERKMLFDDPWGAFRRPPPFRHFDTAVPAGGFVPYPRYALTGGMQPMSGGV